MSKPRYTNKSEARSPRGIMILFMCFFMGLIALCMISLISFEVIHACSVRDQLRSACESAALAGAARLASSDQADPVQTHNDTITAALQAFRANAINGHALSAATQVSVEDHNPAGNEGGILVQLLNPNSSPPNQPVNIGDPNGRIVRVVGSFGLKPVFGTFCHLPGPYTIRGVGTGQVPQLDMVMCFDVSGSIDDQTPVTLVKRYWDASAARIRYEITDAKAGAPTLDGKAQGRIYDILDPPATGTNFGATFPQELSEAGNGGNGRPLSFSPSLRGNPNQAAPPGNYPAGGGTGNNFTFTDCIVNIHEDPSNHSISLPWTSPGGFVYTNWQQVVEISRGNFDDITAFNSARLDTVPEFAGLIPRDGYRADYLQNARLMCKPIGDAQSAAQTFFTIMNTNTEAHFGLVAFSTEGGTTPSETMSASNISSNYAPGGTGNFPRPGIPLHSTITKYPEIMAALPTTVACGFTNIGDAVNKARQQLISQGRPSARKAIIVFTDGQPTAPTSGDPWGYARDAATDCQEDGIPIYTIGLAQNTAIIPGECNILNDDPNRTINYTDSFGQPQQYTPGPSNPGISYIAGNGGKFFLVTNTQHLRLTFENIARQLVQLVRVQ